FPDIATMVALCDQLMAQRRDALRTIRKIEDERERRQTAEKKEEDRRQADDKLLRELAIELQTHAVEPFEAPSIGDIDRAFCLRPALWRDGLPLGWRECMREPWAPQFVRRRALIARVREAAQRGQCSAERAAAIASLIVDDEASARRQLA